MSEVVILEGLFEVILDVLQALLPLVLFFSLFQIISLKLPREYVINLVKGILITLIGMVLFFQGVNIAFLPVGTKLGEYLGTIDQLWLIIPFAFLLGFLSTFAEPAVRVLCYEIENSSSGYIKGSVILYTLSFGVAISVSLAIARIIYDLPFHYMIITGYLIAIALKKFTDKDFIGIAFDSGAVATGPMAVTFIVAFAIGVASSIEGGNALLSGFGTVAFISMTPVLTLLILGIIFKQKKQEIKHDM